ncbi:MAG: zinc-ribbon domain-containing protein [Alphaproteobacteria bacterium]
MIISCPKCKTTYKLDKALLDEDGRKVKCSKCGHIWIQDLFSAELTTQKFSKKTKLVNNFFKNAPKKTPKPKPITIPSYEPEPSYKPDFDNIKKLASDNNDSVILKDKPELKPKSKGLDWIVTESTIKEEKHVKENKAERESRPIIAINNFEPDVEENKNIADVAEELELKLSFIKEEPEVYTIPEVPKDDLAILINKNKRAFKRHLLTIFTIFTVSFLWFSRFQIVELYPQARTFYNLLNIKSVKIGEGLDFKNITRRKIQENDAVFLDIRGYVFNVSLEKRKVPNVEVQLYDENGKFLARNFNKPDAAELEPTYSTAFVVRVSNPPKESAFLIVTFRERGT